MAPFPYKYPLEGYENLPPLDSEARNPDGKSLVNPPTGKLSHAYETFPEPIIKTNNGFDFHSESPSILLTLTLLARGISASSDRVWPQFSF